MTLGRRRERKEQENGENCTKRNLMIFIPHHIVRVSVMKVCEMIRACEARWGEERSTQGFGGET